MPVDGTDDDGVRPGAGSDLGGARVGGLHDEVIVTRTECHCQDLEVGVADPSGHAEAGDRGGGDRPGRAARARRVVQHEFVHLGGLDRRTGGRGDRQRVAGELTGQQERQVRVQLDGVLGCRVVATEDRQRTGDVGQRGEGRQRDAGRQVPGGDGRRPAGHQDLVAAQSAEDRDCHVGGRREHVEDVVALLAVQADPLDSGEGERDATAVEPVGGDDEHVVRLVADQDHQVVAPAAVHRDRGVHRVADEVGAGTGVDGGQRIRAGEGAHHEDVVVVAAAEGQLGAIVEDLEDVVPGVARDARLVADTPGEVTAGGGEVIGHRELGVADVAGEQLADPHQVAAESQVDGQLGRRVVEGHPIVPAEGVELDRGDADGVSDLLGRRELPRDQGGEQGHQAGVGVGAQQQGVRDARAVDGHAVLAGGVVDDVDARVAVAPQVDGGHVGAGAAVDAQQPEQRVGGGSGRIGHRVHGDAVDPGVAPDLGGGTGAGDGQRVVAAAQEHLQQLRGQVVDPVGQPEPGDPGGAHGPDQVGVRAGRVQHHSVAAAVAVHGDLTGDPGEVAAEAGRAGTEPDGVGSGTRVDAGRQRRGAPDDEGVPTRTERELQRFQAEVHDAGAHAETSHGRLRHGAGVGDDVRGIGEGQHVVAVKLPGDTAVNGQQRRDGVEGAAGSRPRGVRHGEAVRAGGAAHVDLVVPGAGVDLMRDRDRADGDPVATPEGVDLDVLDTEAQRHPGVGGGARLELAAADHHVLTLAGAQDLQGVVSLGGGHGDGGAAGAAQLDADQVSAAQRGEGGGSRPRLGTACRRTHRDLAVSVADQERVGEAGARQHGEFELRAEVLSGGTGQEVGSGRRAEHQQVVVQPYVLGHVLDDGVGTAGVGEDVLAGAAGHDVVAQAGVEAVGERRTDQPVSVGLATQGQRRAVGGEP